MKTLRIYEASDITFEDTLQATLLAQMLVALLSRPQGSGPDGKPTGDEVQEWMKRRVADHLNAIEKAGYTIVRREDVPEVMRS